MKGWDSFLGVGRWAFDTKWRGLFERERRMVKTELQALSRVFMEDTGYNSVAKTVGTALLVGVWSAVYVMISLGWAIEPPFFKPFTVLVWAIAGRWWGIELVWESVDAGTERRFRGDGNEKQNGDGK